MAIQRLKPYIDNETIYEEEIDTFIQIIEKKNQYWLLPWHLQQSNSTGH